ncbi:MAG: glycolate oxidase subunit GlcE [Pseudomonadales bacterium]
MNSDDISTALQDQVLRAIAENAPLRISGGGSKQFYGEAVAGTPLSTLGHTGIIHYDPTELVVTARAGTPLSELEHLLASEHQILGCESPHFGSATVGGMVAAGLSGPRRPYAGAVRDFVLGCSVLNGKGEILSFGGQVMKNVAGYDVSRLMAGSMGCLGIILDVSLKLIPQPETEISLCFEKDAAEGIKFTNTILRQGIPVSASCQFDGKLYLRFSGFDETLTAAQQQLGGEKISNAFWPELRDQKLAFFSAQSDKNLWRLSLAPNTPELQIVGESLYEWGGALRWLRTNEDTDKIRQLTQAAGGSATLFKSAENKHGVNTPVFHPLAAGLLNWHEQLKLAMDPNRIFNSGRLYNTV